MLTTATTTAEQLIFRILFVNRILRANGDNFQSLFWQVMRAKHKSDFIEIRPQGSKGDGGNDGFLLDSGHYFQVYGPIDPESRVKYATNKLSQDFEKLKKNWDHLKPIQAYSFVYNDKYLASFPTIVKALLALEHKHNVKCRPFMAGDLEDAFMELPSSSMSGILGQAIPDPSQVIQIDYSILRDVIDHIMLSPSRSVTTRFGDLPTLDEKITLNHLCSAWRDIIRNGARHAGHIDLYYEKSSAFAKQALKDHLLAVYEKCRNEGRAAPKFPEGISLEDCVFGDFREQLLPANATTPMQFVVDVIIGKFFEACDIFDPHAAKEVPNASP